MRVLVFVSILISTAHICRGHLECFSWKCILTKDAGCQPIGSQEARTCKPGEVCFQWIDAESGQIYLSGCEQSLHDGECKLTGTTYDCQCSSDQCNSNDDPMWINEKYQTEAPLASALEPVTVSPQKTVWRQEFDHNTVVQKGSAHESPGLVQKSQYKEQRNVQASYQQSNYFQWQNPPIMAPFQQPPPVTAASQPALTCFKCANPLCSEFVPKVCKPGELCLQKVSPEDGTILAVKCGPHHALGCTMTEKIQKAGARELNYWKCACNTNYCNAQPLLQ